MLIINYKKNIAKTYEEKNMPDFKNVRSRISWIRNQNMSRDLYNMESISIQVRDMKQIPCSESTILNSLYAKYVSRLKNLKDEDYISFSTKTANNRWIIRSLMAANWLLIKNQFDEFNLEEIEKIKSNLEKTILEIKNMTSIDYSSVDKIQLIQYKINCIDSYLLNRIEEEKESIIDSGLEDKIIVGTNGTEFIFPAYPIITKEDIGAKIIEWGEKLRLAELEGDTKKINKAEKMLFLLRTQKFYGSIADCQDFYIKNDISHEPTKSPEEREYQKSLITRKNCKD